ncbi:hypothetical protein PSTG_18798 [Puccinia striiformis f. sp. tritici PST-78]|uniref:Uncharacterized protein n=1 Tax=Puccinia striiformis f. sp. tritici PST-78 TaxID=1165861 RepID=A0A0L0UKK4_9BASI|nr:hypothetical protein PSTG_19407 [Puccinia striiformis f. sp. tritici PST-78]KNE87470.1 hypothetical protein PSTG_19145 [Puccinia striiformis f. sp. tritici PST-78]KNE87811.1 hypothetical protein PSTG_18798 [Puccinia striiformis f. sp. tritici PST-78]
MPFLYGLIMGMFHKRGLSSDTFEDENARESANVHNDLEGVVGDQVPEMYGEVAFVKLLTGKEQAFARCSRGQFPPAPQLGAVLCMWSFGASAGVS